MALAAVPASSAASLATRACEFLLSFSRSTCFPTLSRHRMSFHFHPSFISLHAFTLHSLSQRALSLFLAASAPLVVVPLAVAAATAAVVPVAVAVPASSAARLATSPSSAPAAAAGVVVVHPASAGKPAPRQRSLSGRPLLWSGPLGCVWA